MGDLRTDQRVNRRGCMILLTLVGIVIFFFVCLLISGEDGGGSGAGTGEGESARSNISAAEESAKQIAWMDEGKAATRAKLKDPDSAQFRGVRFSRSSGTPVTCGEVNSKNSFGGYTGYQRFVSGGTAALTFLDEQAADFDEVWKQLCQ